MKRDETVKKIRKAILEEYPKAIVGVTSIDGNSQEMFEVNILNTKKINFQKVFKILYSKQNNSVKVIEADSPKIIAMKVGKSVIQNRIEFDNTSFKETSKFCS